MGANSADPVLTARRSAENRRPPFSVYVAGLVGVLVLAAGAGLGFLDRAGRLSGGLLFLILAGLLVFIAASVVFYRRAVRPVTELSTGVRDLMTGASSGPLAVSGPPEVASLVRDINQLIARARADVETTSELAAIVESSADAIIGGTLDGIITNWNAGAEEDYGYTADEVIGRGLALIIPPGRDGELASILGRIRRGERVKHLETKRRRKDGTIVDVSVSVSPIRDATGAVTGAATVARDITERTRLDAGRRALERQRQQSERLESLGQMAAGIAHDFNNLLGVIINYASFVAEQTTGLPAVQADIEQIKGAAERAARIIRQLLIVGRRDLEHPEVLGLNAVIADTRDLLAAAIGASIHIRVNTAPDLPAIQADRGQVEQVLLNLAVNARDAMPQGGTLTIETGVAEFSERQASARLGARPGRYVEFTVSDTGNGMSADTVARIFDPFFTTKPVGKGTGLGLATVHSVVTRADGSISVESEPGIGTTFRILLPVAAAAPAVPAARVADTQGNGQTILVVEDEEPMLKLTSRILRQNGYATLEAGTYEAALSMASSQDVQLLLTDSVMPSMSGPTLAEHIAKMRPGVPVLYMSGHSTQALSQRISHDRARYIQKPFTPHDLLEMVHSALTAPRPPAR